MDGYHLFIWMWFLFLCLVKFENFLWIKEKERKDVNSSMFWVKTNGPWLNGIVLNSKDNLWVRISSLSNNITCNTVIVWKHKRTEWREREREREREVSIILYYNNLVILKCAWDCDSLIIVYFTPNILKWNLKYFGVNSNISDVLYSKHILISQCVLNKYMCFVKG